MVGKSDEDLSLADFVFTSRSHSINGLKFYLEKNNSEKRKCSNAMYSYCTATTPMAILSHLLSPNGISLIGRTESRNRKVRRPIYTIYEEMFDASSCIQLCGNGNSLW